MLSVTSVLIFFTHGFIFLTPHVYSMPNLRLVNDTTPNFGCFVVMYHQETNCVMTISLHESICREDW